MLHTLVAEKAKQQLVHLEIELMEAVGVVGAERSFLLAQVPVERGEKPRVGAWRDRSRGFDFQRAADEHGLMAVTEVDAGDTRTALGENLDKAFGREASQRLRHRKAGDAEP